MQIIDELVSRLISARDAYESGHSVMSDTEYDLLEAELKNLDPENPFLQDVGSSKLASGWVKVPHEGCPIIMGSQNKALSREAASTFFVEHPDLEYLVSLKGDGMSIRLQYTKGKLSLGATRGDGSIGEDITANVSKMLGVPLVLPEPVTAHLRGEIILTRSAFTKAKADGLPVKTPRNAGVGFAKDTSGANAHRLQVYCYDLYIEDMSPFSTEFAKFKYMEKLGFTCIPWSLVTSYDTYIESFWKSWVTPEDRALETDIPADGVIIKCNTLSKQEEFGYSSNGLNPSFSIAHKFAPPVVQCKVLDILWDPGPTGVITPVLQVDAQLDDIHLQNVSGHNLKKLLDMGIKIGSTIIVERAGMVIPYLVGVANV